MGSLEETPLAVKLLENRLYIVGRRGVVQLGGQDPWYKQGGNAKVGAEGSLVV